MKARTLFAIAMVSLPAAAQTEAHPDTAGALRCLVEHNHQTCRYGFVGSASRSGKGWQWQNPHRDFELGSLLSSSYVGTENDSNVFVARFLYGRTVDVYDVKFQHYEKTFYISPPDVDGNIHYLLVRDGGPADERRELFIHGPS